MGVYKNLIEPFLFKRQAKVAPDSAYVRAGAYANEVQEGPSLLLKNSGPTNNNTRVPIIRVPSGFSGELKLKIYYSSAGVSEATDIRIYGCGDNWSSSTVTYNTLPSYTTALLATFNIAVNEPVGYKTISFNLPAGVGSIILSGVGFTTAAYGFDGHLMSNPPIFE